VRNERRPKFTGSLQKPLNILIVSGAAELTHAIGTKLITLTHDKA